MANFDKVYPDLISKEGFYSDSSNDRGGETIFGISRKYHPNWEGWSIVDFNKSNGTLESLRNDEAFGETVKAFYKKEFWDCSLLDSFPDQKLAEEVFDTGVNCSPKFSIICLQRTLNVLNKMGKLWSNISVDGKIGPKTIEALNSAVVQGFTEVIFKGLNILQGMRYFEICEKDETQEVFSKGWLAHRIGFE